jgi:hypothetical protein
MLEVLSPGVEHAKETDVRTQVLRIASQLEHRRSAGAVEQIVFCAIVGAEDWTVSFDSSVPNSQAFRPARHSGRSLECH